jgi:predicted amidohydrolase
MFQNCELLVFPEYGLTGPNIGALGRENLKDIRWVCYI